MDRTRTRQTKSRESALYPGIQQWMTKHFHCFESAIDVGLKFSRIDVFGIRDVGGMLSGDVETICIEVKRGNEPFATASGQTLGYSIYANRVYLADWRPKCDFQPNELDIARHLGIGLIRIRGGKGNDCEEVLSSPSHDPISRMSLELMWNLGLARCRLCGTVFESGDRKNHLSNVVRQSLRNAIVKDKGFAYWLRELYERKADSGISHGLPNFQGKAEYSMEKRLICRECVELFRPLLYEPPKFKVGDRVTVDLWPEEGVGKITRVGAYEGTIGYFIDFEHTDLVQECHVDYISQKHVHLANIKVAAAKAQKRAGDRIAAKKIAPAVKGREASSQATNK